MTMKMKMVKSLLLASVACLLTAPASAQSAAPAAAAPAAAAPAAKQRILVHLTQGPENPTRAALVFLIARTAVEEGNSVTMFLAGDAVQLIRDPVLDNLTGLGTGKLREHYDIIVKGGGKIYLAGNSSKARGITEADLKGKPVEMGSASVLLKLATENDRMLTY
jgi:predicted peroxiredoxin